MNFAVAVYKGYRNAEAFMACMQQQCKYLNVGVCCHCTKFKNQIFKMKEIIIHRLHV